MEDLSTKFERVGAGYIYTKTIHGHTVEASISRVKESSDRVKAEVGIVVNGMPIARSNPVLTSVSGLDSFWRKLARRLPQTDWQIDWESYVEQLAARVIDSHREGDPELELSSVQIPTTVAWQIEPMLLAGQANVLFGPGGSGKSMIGLWFSVLMDTAHVDTQHALTVKPGRVLYLDWETDSIEIASRVRDLQNGMNLNGHKTGIIYRRCNQSLAQEADRIKDIIDKYKIDMLVIDSLGLATGGGLDEAESVLEYFAALRWLGGTSLTITHTNKEGHLFGSVYTLNCGRSIWEVKKHGGDEDAIDVGLWHRKVNVVGKQKPQAFGMEFLDGSIVISAKDTMESEVVAEGLSVPELVYQIVAREAPVERGLLAERVAMYRGEAESGNLKASVSTAITRHINAGRLVNENGLLNIHKESDGEPKEGEWTLL